MSRHRFRRNSVGSAPSNAAGYLPDARTQSSRLTQARTAGSSRSSVATLTLLAAASAKALSQAVSENGEADPGVLHPVSDQATITTMDKPLDSSMVLNLRCDTLADCAFALGLARINHRNLLCLSEAGQFREAIGYGDNHARGPGIVPGRTWCHHREVAVVVAEVHNAVGLVSPR